VTDYARYSAVAEALIGGNQRLFLTSAVYNQAITEFAHQAVALADMLAAAGYGDLERVSADIERARQEAARPGKYALVDGYLTKIDESAARMLLEGDGATLGARGE
jgi:hypothetical protein